ncbi:MAG: tripartite tricarboxylate transporter substrate binding protein [Xanthobacteraceae bacterium]
MSRSRSRTATTFGVPIRWREFIVALGGAAASALAAPAQSFPDHPVKVVVAYPAGGPTDTIARVVTRGLSADLGQSVVVENQAGAGGRIGTRAVARAAPDGYTLLLGGSNNNAITPALYKGLDFDPMKDFAPIAALATESLVLVIHPSVPARTLSELVRYGKENPGKLTSGATVGIAPHLLLEFIRIRSGTNMMFVPYKGAAPAITDVLGGQIQVHVSAKSVLLPLINSGKLRALVVTSADRWPELPEVPTMRESGFDGFPTAQWFGLLAPAGTSGDVIGKLNAAVAARLTATDTREAFAKIGLEPHMLSPREFGQVLAEEVRRWGAVVQETGVKLE